MGDLRKTAAWAQARLAWQVLIDAGQVDCRRCGLPIAPVQAWDFGHPDDRPHWANRSDPSVLAVCRPEHMRCNRRAGPHQRRAVRAARSVSAEDPSRLW